LRKEKILDAKKGEHLMTNTEKDSNHASEQASSQFVQPTVYILEDTHGNSYHYFPGSATLLCRHTGQPLEQHEVTSQPEGLLGTLVTIDLSLPYPPALQLPPTPHTVTLVIPDVDMGNKRSQPVNSVVITTTGGSFANIFVEGQYQSYQIDTLHGNAFHWVFQPYEASKRRIS
jgi:hypothetical protein